MKKFSCKKNWLTRTVCRLIGEERGAVMMEYVMLGVLIAAACVGSAYMLSATFRDGMNVMANAIVGGIENTKKARTNAATTQGNNEKQAETAHQTITNSADGDGQ